MGALEIGEGRYGTRKCCVGFCKCCVIALSFLQVQHRGCWLADAEERYENTPAFRPDSLLRKAAKESGFAFVPYLGRLLTRMHQRKHVVQRRVAQAWFARDGTHLSREGYEKVSQKLH